MVLIRAVRAFVDNRLTEMESDCLPLLTAVNYEPLLRLYQLPVQIIAWNCGTDTSFPFKLPHLHYMQKIWNC